MRYHGTNNRTIRMLRSSRVRRNWTSILTCCWLGPDFQPYAEIARRLLERRLHFTFQLLLTISLDGKLDIPTGYLGHGLLFLDRLASSSK